MRDILDIIRQRQSSRVPFDPERPVSDSHLQQILEAGRWAPTAHNMQNFDVIVVDDWATLATIGAIPSQVSATFLRENYQQLSFSEEEFLQRKTGLLASMFPPSWRAADAKPAARDLADMLQSCPLLLIVTYDLRQRAPASEGDVLGIMSLGCVMQNMWLMAEALGLGMQILSALSSQEAESALHRILAIPDHRKIAFACRLGYAESAPGRYLRVRRDVEDFTHHNRYGNRALK
jgi:nitroreductase